MSATSTDESILTINFAQDIQIAASLELAFESVLEQLGPLCQMPDGSTFPMTLEAWPGGRWFRDLGSNAGHLWGHVQVIKPPTLVELCGPMFMSYPAINHVQYRLKPHDGGTRLALAHRALGLIPADHREGAGEFWKFHLSKIREVAEGRTSAITR